MARGHGGTARGGQQRAAARGTMARGGERIGLQMIGGFFLSILAAGQVQD